MKHPTDRGARRRSAAAHSLEGLVPKRIDAKIKHKKVELLDKETQDELDATDDRVYL